MTSGLVVMDSMGALHRFPTGKSHRTVSIGTHLQVSIHEHASGLGDALGVFVDPVWIKAAEHVIEPENQGE